jgi:hypothetical protein
MELSRAARHVVSRLTHRLARAAIRQDDERALIG